MAIIVAAHAGTGKTYAARMNENLFTDLTYYTYRYNVPEDCYYNEAEDSESTKGKFRYPFKNEYPDNYLEAIKEATQVNKFILIVPDPWILSRLQMEDIPYIVAYPVRSARNEYKQRFISRGNKSRFLKIFIDRWDKFMDDFERNTYARHIVMQPHQYLSDVLDECLLSKSIEEIGDKSTWKVFTNEDADLLTGEHIIIPTGHDEIGEFAFKWREDIKSVVIPDGVCYVADSAFAGSRLSNTNLIKVELPDSVKVIDVCAFAENGGLTDIVFGNALREIRLFAFSKCIGLKNLLLPDSLESVERGAFYGCKGLADGGVTFKGKTYGLNFRGDYCDVVPEFYAAVNGEESW